MHQGIQNSLEEIILYKSGFWIRLAASFLDGLIIGIPTVIIAGLLTGNYDSDEPIAQILSSLYAIFYLFIGMAERLVNEFAGFEFKYMTHKNHLKLLQC